MPENFAAASSRAFPNDGLTASQMAYAVRRVGLEPVVIGAVDRHVLNGLAYAFLRCRIPSVLVYVLKERRGDEFVEIGQHAVAITGFSLDDQAPALPRRAGEFQLRSTRIDKLYGHDDQVGPFARMAWSGGEGAGEEIYPRDQKWLKTSRPGEVYAEINFVLLPLYHKIRIPYSLIHDAVLQLDKLVEEIRPATKVSRGEWDIYLTTANDYKISARTEYPSWGIDPAETLYTSLPRFMWRVLLRVDNQVELDFLFDATGIAQHNLVVHHISRGGYQMILKLIAKVRSDHGTDPSCQVAAVLDAITADALQSVVGPIAGGSSERVTEAYPKIERVAMQAANDADSAGV
jgi:hypothetical protein